MPKNNGSKKSRRIKYNIPIEDFEKSNTGSKSDELKNTNNRNDKEDVNKHQFEDETECNKPLKEGKKHNNSNNEPDVKHIDSMISDEKKIVLDLQNEHFTTKICSEAERSYERNHRESKNENNDNQPELPDKMDEKVEKESNRPSRSKKKKKKNKSSDRHHKDSLNCNNKTENDNDKPNIISSTDKRRSRSRQGHSKPHHKEMSCGRSRNRDSSNSNCTSNKNENRNNVTNVCEKDTYHGDSKFKCIDANNEPSSKRSDFNSDKTKTSLDQQKNKNRVVEMEHKPSGTTQDINGEVQKERNKKKQSKGKKNTISDHDSLNNNGNKTENYHNKQNFTSPTTEGKKSYERDHSRSRRNINTFSDKYYSKSKHDNKNIYSKLKYNQLNSSGRDSTNEYTGDAECKFNQIDEDLFNLPDEFSLAHCVAEDLRMGAGIAVEFKRRFGGVGKLFDQNLRVGDVGIVNRHNRTVFYLITKKMSSGKPTMKSLEKALFTLLDKMKELNLTKLGIPQIGCGLDNLDWSEVSLLIKQIFSGSNIQITVCIPSKIESKKSWPLKVYVTSINLWDMVPETVFIIFIDLGNKNQNDLTNNVVEEINKKYPFKENLLKDIKNKKLKPGDITDYHVNNEVIFCVFTNQNKYFTSIEEAFLKINRMKKSKYIYSAIQSGLIEDYIERIVLIYRSTVNNSELWLCGLPGQGQQLAYEQYCSSMRRYSLKSLDITK